MNTSIWKPLAGLLAFFTLSTAQAASYQDDEIASIVSTANIAEIEAAKVAQSTAQNKQVRDFAAQMIRDHKKMDAQMGKLAVKLKLNPTPTEKSDSLKSEANADLEKLKMTPKGSAFDKQYIEGQVKDHQQVLDLINNDLIPSAKNEQLANLLQQSSKKVAAHLENAKKLQEEINSTH